MEIKPVFRVIMDGDKEIKQWKDLNVPDDDWKNLYKDPEKRKYKQRCDGTIDMFAPTDQDLLGK